MARGVAQSSSDLSLNLDGLPGERVKFLVAHAVELTYMAAVDVLHVGPHEFAARHFRSNGRMTRQIVSPFCFLPIGRRMRLQFGPWQNAPLRFLSDDQCVGWDRGE
jgi:aminopeptidase-like protein